MDWNDSYIASAFLPIAIRLSSRAHCYCNSGLRRRIVQPEISICSGEEYPISAVAAGLLKRVRREAVGQVLDAELLNLLKRLREYPGVAELKASLMPQSPVLPITFRRDNKRFSYFSLITTVGTPQCITAQELRVECMFPTEVEGR